MRRTLPLLALALAACQSTGAQNACPEAKPAPAKWSMPAPAHLPQAARAILAERMQRHGAAMTDMVWAALFLDYDSAADIAQEIASEPRLARPFSRDASELNALLPESFFALQDELAARAEEVARVAPTKDPAALSASVGRLTDTCMRCHSAYLRDTAAP